MFLHIKDKYLKALRSGEYKQGVFGLRTIDDKFCALGVLCDLAAKEGIIQWEHSGFAYWIKGGTYYLPKSVMKWAGMCSQSGRFPEEFSNEDVSKYSIANMNDDKNNFNTIADAVEKNWERL